MLELFLQGGVGGIKTWGGVFFKKGVPLPGLEYNILDLLCGGFIKPEKVEGETMSSLRFSIVEIVLSIMVIMIGIIGVIPLINIGVETNKKSIGISNSADSGSQFLNYVISMINEDGEFSNCLPDAIPIDESLVVWSNQSLLDDSDVKIYFSSENEFDSFDYTRNISGQFLIKQFTTSNVIDFSAVIKSWKEREVINDPRYYGGIMPWGIVSSGDDGSFGYENSVEYLLKYNSGHGSLSTHGNFGCLALGGNGAGNYRSNIINGYNGSLSIGDVLSSEPGNMAGPTVQGLESVAIGTYIRIPVVSQFSTGRCEVTVLGFLPFRIVSDVSGGHGNRSAEVRAQYIGLTGESCYENGNDILGMKYNIKCQVSWPSDVPYDQRTKRVYQSEIFRVKR